MLYESKRPEIPDIKIESRDYQIESVVKTGEALGQGIKRPLIVAPTASGKSIIIAEMVVKALQKAPGLRILIIVHQGHLLIQNEQKILAMRPDTQTGVFCANEGRKEWYAQIVLASRDSLGRNPGVCGKFSLCIVDEAHVVDLGTEKKPTQYGKIFGAQDDPMVIGLTGTPWRLGNGLIYGEGKFFQKKSYDIKMSLLIERGYLCDYIFPDHDVKEIDASQLQVQSTGDYSSSDLNKISTPEGIVEKCIDNWEKHASDRRCTIFFCCSKEHGKLVAKSLRDRIGEEAVVYVDGDLNKKNRKQKLAEIVEGKYRCIVNIGVLTTGFDAPIIDCVAWLRATDSVSLFVQMGGRGLRTYPGKENCLMLDMAGNFEKFASLENPYVPEKKNKKIEGEIKKIQRQGAAQKECPSCLSLVPSAASICDTCGHIFFNHETGYYSLVPVIYEVQRFTIETRSTKRGDEAKVVKYWTNLYHYFQQWLMIERADTKYGRKGLKLYRQLNSGQFVPKKIKVTNKKDSNFPNVEVVEFKKVDSGVCPHINIDSATSPYTNQHYEYCLDCGDMV